MVQVSGLLFLLVVSVCFVLVSFFVGAISIKMRDYYSRTIFQKAFVTPIPRELMEKKINLNEVVVNRSYDAKRIGEKVLRRRY